jgi:hypothetical protein
MNLRGGITMPRQKTAVKTSAGTTSRKNNSTKITMRHSEDISEQIREKAYEIFLKKGCYHGDDQADWFEAEKEIKSKHKFAGVNN